MTIITGHDGPEHAHLSFVYPYGHGRCIRREFIESHPRSREQRFTMQTTHPSFNGVYTKKLDTDGVDAANAWAESEIVAGRVRWNTPKRSTYVLGIVMGERDLEDGSGRRGVYPVHLTPNTTLEIAQAVLDNARDRLDERTIGLLDRIIAYQTKRANAAAAA